MTEVGFVRVCSKWRSLKTDFIFFEEAKNPLLTVEHLYEEKEVKKNGKHKKPEKEKDKEDQDDHEDEIEKRFVLVSKSLKGINLLQNPRPTFPLEIDLSQLKELYGDKSWKYKKLRAYICEDFNGTGTCSEKKGYYKLSIGSRSFRADRIPDHLTFEVYSGRSRLLETDPELCEKQISPLVLDMNGNGIRLTGPGKGVRFDLDATGEKLLTGWVDSKDDVFLVRDLNRNGTIDSGAELFGTATRMPDGMRAVNGFEALKVLDSNKDGVFNEKDGAWPEMRLWTDKNQDGDTDSHELLTLKVGGVISIDLGYSNSDDIDPYGNITKQRSTFIRRVNGKAYTQTIIDVWFNTLIPH